MTEPLAPDSAELAEQVATFRSAYVHIPFCGSVCPYCDFAVVAGRDDLVRRYVAAVLLEMEMEPEWHELDAVFIGGGTPSRLPVAAVGSLLEALDRRFGLRPDAEVTLEANPEDIDRTSARGLAGTGVNRLSLGAQSLDPVVLTSLGRAHSPARVEIAVEAARDAGFSSISLDLIYGTPGESYSSWRRTLEGAVGMEPNHISAYALTVELPTPLGRAVRAGAPAPDPDDQADKWELAVEVLGAAGFVRYEVSNHARPGHTCAYNLSVWGMGEYLAFGLGAHGYRDGVRSRRVRRLDTYLRRVEAGLGPIQATEAVEGSSAERERLMVGLRRTAGVRAGDLGRQLVESPVGARLMAAGVLESRDGRLRVTRPLLTDEVVRAVLEL